MADLKAMFAKKPQPEGKKDEPVTDASNTPIAGVDGGTQHTPVEPTPASPPAAQPNKFPRFKKAAAPLPEAAGSGDASRGGEAGTDGGQPQPDAAGSNQPDGQATGGGDKPKPRLAGFNFGRAPADSNASASPVSAGPISSLDDLDSSEDTGVVARSSGFSDETPATKPTRELPEDMDKSTMQFVDLIDGVYEIIHDPELLGNVIRSIMIELKANPQYTKLICDDDVRTWVRAMRDSMGLARVKKVEAKARRSGSKTKSGSKAVDTDMLADLADLGLGDLG